MNVPITTIFSFSRAIVPVLIHEANPQSRPVVIIVSAHVVRSSVRPSVRPSIPTFHKTKQFQAKTMFATGETVGPAEWIIDDTCLVDH